MVGRTKEQGLSEVIGFLMIVSLLTILFSMYLVYVVPIQGRDAEISHMKYITQEFIGLKSDLDGLIINNKINMPIARSFELGTLSSVGSGALSILPMSSFIEANGMLMVNEQNDFLTVTVNGDLVNLSNLPPVVDPPITQPVLEIQCISFDQCPSNPLNFTISDRFYNITTQERYSINNSAVNIDITWPNKTPFFVGNATFEIPGYQPSYDLVLQTYVNTTPPRPFISQRTLIENLTFPNNFTYNVLKDNDLTPNNSADYFLINPSESISPDLYVPRVVTTNVDMFPPRIGSFQYESSNRYWVNQNLLYEMGGLFLTQPVDGGSSVMLIPSIALTPVQNISQNANPAYPLKVSINNIRITDTEDISGSVSAQIFSKIDQTKLNLFNGSDTIDPNLGTASRPASLWKMREGETSNAKAIWLQFIPDDPRIINSSFRDTTRYLYPEEKKRMRETTELWKRAFDQIKTITNKTLSDNADRNPLVGQYSRWMYNFRIVDETDSFSPTSPPYSANMVIGESASSLSTSCPPITDATKAATCRGAIDTYMGNPPAADDKFILDYVESDVSLVMQSGAL